MGKNRQTAGYLTVEASIAFTVFLCMLIFIAFLVKFACQEMVLSHAVSETAKKLAASCYPVAFINEWEDDFFDSLDEFSFPTYEEEMSLFKTGEKDPALPPSPLAGLLSGQVSIEEMERMLEAFTEGQDMLRQLLNSLEDDYFKVKTKAKYAAAMALLERFLENSPVDRDRLRLVLVELPQGNAEFFGKTLGESYLELYEELGIEPEQDNVVVAVEYDFEIPVPFFGSKKLTGRYTAVERGWVNGSSGAYFTPSGKGDEEGGKNGDRQGEEPEDALGQETVFVTNYGTRYHRDGCEYLKRSKIPITLDAARERGYVPCKVCVLGTAEYRWKKGYKPSK